MPATRTHPQASTSAVPADLPSTGGKKRNEKHKNQKKRELLDVNASGSAIPGVQKLKAALRQTRRLLTKDKLAADVRVAAERKLKAQEAELERAETARKERTMATRYHKVKFFERQKVMRKIKQVKKQLESPEISSKDNKKFTKALHALRVDLNYINHYPKTAKYVSLFPPEARSGAVPPSSLELNAAETDARRLEIRAQIAERMENGELNAEPEMEAGKWEHIKSSSSGTTTGRKSAKSEKPSVGGDEFFDVGDSEDEDEEHEEDNY